MESPLKSALLAIRLASEIALLAVLAIVGAGAGFGTAADVTLALLCPIAAAVVWGIGIAPRARRRWPDPWRLVAETVLFGAAAAGLAVEGALAWAVIFAVSSIGIAAAVRVWAAGS